MIYAFLWPNFTSASAYCYLDWFEIPLQFHELHKPNPVPNCALRHLSQTKLCAPTNQSHPFLFHHQTHHQTLWFPCRHFDSKDLNLHLMGISPCRTVDPIYATFHLQVQPQLSSSNRVSAPNRQSSISIFCDSCSDMAMDMAMDCLPFNNLGTLLIQFDLRSSHVLSWRKGRKGAQLHTCARKEWKTSQFFAERLLEVLWSLYVCM